MENKPAAGTTWDTLEQRNEPQKPSYGGAVGDAERYRTDDGRLHDEAPDGRGYERRAGEPTYPPGVENQFEIGRGESKSAVERYGDELGLVQTGVIDIDTRLRDFVMERLRNATSFAADRVEVVVDNGVVSLTGTIASAAARDDLEAEVSHMTGVREVRSTIRLVPPTTATTTTPKE